MAWTRRNALLAGAMTPGLLAIPSASAEAESVTTDIDERLDLGFRSGLLQGLHAVLAMQRGDTLVERYFAGPDESWGRQLGNVQFDANTLHDLRSVTKSVASLLYGIALADGLVPNLDARLLDSFPQYPDLAEDPVRMSWTISHVLNMSMGTEWNEDLPYTDPANSEIAMEMAEDRYRFILDRPIVSEPGAHWNYNGGCSALVGYLIEQGAKQTIDEFAKARLFGPLGIDEFEWHGGRDGVVSVASGLRLRAPDLARIGQMMLADGRWNGQQIVPADWLERCRTPQIDAAFGARYSHQWYLTEQPVRALGEMRPAISGMGNGGQRLILMPSLDLVVVIFAGNYNRMDQWINPTLVLQRIILAALDA